MHWNVLGPDFPPLPVMPGISCSEGSTTPGTWAEYITMGSALRWPLFCYGALLGAVTVTEWLRFCWCGSFLE